MKKPVSAVLAVLVALLTVLSVMSVGVAAVLDPGYSVRIVSPRGWVPVGAFMQLTAEISVPEGCTQNLDDFVIVWSADEHAEMIKDGMVYGVSAGLSNITVTVTEPESGETFSATTQIDITTFMDAVNDALSKNNILGFRFNGQEKFYLYDQETAWQKYIGFMNAFDYVAPYTTLNYDYVRVHYNYAGKAHMIQLWKGQYGIMFYGSEIGKYYMDHELKEGEEINALTRFNCATEDEEMLNMQSTLYWDAKNDGNYEYQFTIPYGKYWWCTGFRIGHLWHSEPADELRMESFIDFHDEEEATAFSDAIEKCGFKRGASADTLELDSFAQSGNRVSIKWQNISEAQNTVVVKTTLNALIATGSFAAVIALLAFVLISLFSFGFLVFLIII